MIGFLTALKEERVSVRRSWDLGPSGTLQGLELETGRDCVHLCTGMGQERMNFGVEVMEKAFQPDLLVLVGYSVAIRPELKVGDLVCDTRSNPQLLEELKKTSLAITYATIGTCGYLQTSSVKAETGRRLAPCPVADLESEVFLAAADPSRAVLLVRSVSDDVNSDLPLDFSKYVDSKGFPDQISIGLKTASWPPLIPRMIRLAGDAAKATDSLTTFLREARPILQRYGGLQSSPC